MVVTTLSNKKYDAKHTNDEKKKTHQDQSGDVENTHVEAPTSGIYIEVAGEPQMRRTTNR